MQTFPKISIITPSLNQGKFIEKTILSVINQNYPDLEYIIIDGGSIDNTVDIIKKYEKYLSYWISEKDSGQSNAINKGLKKSSGELIAWINSDDFYCENVFTKIAEYFELNKNVNWLYGNTFFINEKGEMINYKKPLKFNKFVLRYGSFSFNQPGVFLRRKIIEDIGFLREDFHTIMDQEWFCRIADIYKPSYLDIDIAKFRWHSSGKSSSDKNSEHYRRLKQERQFIFHKYLPGLSFIYDKYPAIFFIVLNFFSRIIKSYYRLLRECRWRRNRDS